MNSDCTWTHNHVAPKIVTKGKARYLANRRSCSFADRMAIVAGLQTTQRKGNTMWQRIDTLERNDVALFVYGDGNGRYWLTCYDGGGKVYDKEFDNVDAVRNEWIKVATDNDLIAPPM